MDVQVSVWEPIAPDTLQPAGMVSAPAPVVTILEFCGMATVTAASLTVLGPVLVRRMLKLACPLFGAGSGVKSYWETCRSVAQAVLPAANAKASAHVARRRRAITVSPLPRLCTDMSHRCGHAAAATPRVERSCAKQVRERFWRRRVISESVEPPREARHARIGRGMGRAGIGSQATDTSRAGWHDRISPRHTFLSSPGDPTPGRLIWVSQNWRDSSMV